MSVLWLEAADPAAVREIGGKAAGLARLMHGGFPVPDGFVVTTSAYGRHLHDRKVSATYEAIAASTPPDDVASDIRTAYRDLCRRSGQPDVPVAVRSSATAEDMGNASFAGQQETYLGIRGEEAVVAHVVRCWASLFTPMASAYRQKVGIPDEAAEMAVVVQRVVEAEAAGVMFTLNPVSGDRSKVCLEAAPGLGVALVGGEVTPDRYLVDKVTLRAVERQVGSKPFAYGLDETGGLVKDAISDERGGEPCLTDTEVSELAAVAKRVERYFGAPQDIEFAVGEGRRVWILQARPETVWSSSSAAGSNGGPGPESGAKGGMAYLVDMLSGKRP